MAAASASVTTYMLRRWRCAPSVASNVPCPSGQLIQQRLRVLQVRRIETFGEPVVDRTKQVTGFHVLALVAPEPSEAGRCPQLKELRALPLGNCDGLTIVPSAPE